MIDQFDEINHKFKRDKYLKSNVCKLKKLSPGKFVVRKTSEGFKNLKQDDQNNQIKDPM